MTLQGWRGRWTDQGGGGGGGDGSVGEPELRGLGATGEPITLTVSGAIGKPAPFCARCCEDGVGTEGEPELCMLSAVGEPTAGTVSGAIGKLAMYEWLDVRGGDDTIGEPELLKLLQLLLLLVIT